ncbi:hypothetical protein PV325_006927 [Microctonus aethiopoides]|uniref:Uncharacterized protein n=1 Tax=Microctonus aethiopoides TaxID=144406 RepID=A0AA39EZR4_9HYME|nr:hypothetical protein PV325_006927 [Microctonus aethiopoides]KAK0160244.1 hypothetical protein PV328_007672 [Microctonus aethiopoides]
MSEMDGRIVVDLQSKLRVINNYWEKFETQHEKMMQVRDSGIVNTDYYKSKVYEDLLKKHHVNRAILVSEIARKCEPCDLSESMKVAAPSSTSNIPFKTNLPPIDIRKFSGN